MKGLFTMSNKEVNRIAIMDKLLKKEVKQKKAEIIDSKRLNLKMEEIKLNQKQMAVITSQQSVSRQWRPAANHPWRQYAYTNTNY